ncbi:MAG: glucosyltransferase [Pycnora praestabilis]|nr:MAG: glucosyltransferase [Pycnora praestabilis]
MDCSTFSLRSIDLASITVFIPLRVCSILDTLREEISESKAKGTGNGQSTFPKLSVDMNELHTILNICLFPPLFFFSALYYTDLLSAVFVLGAYESFLKAKREEGAQVSISEQIEKQAIDQFENAIRTAKKDLPRLLSKDQAQQIKYAKSRSPPAAEESTHLRSKVADSSAEGSRGPVSVAFLRAKIWWSGVLALLFRQTNIFWVAIFLGGLQVVRTLEKCQASFKEGKDETLLEVARNAYEYSELYDPSVSEASVEDYIKTIISIGIGAAVNYRRVLSALMPYLALLATFGVFVVWNGGVVLGSEGDKSNHVATIHLPQMLYIWPYLMFFSFPMIYPYILNVIVPQVKLPRCLRYGSMTKRLPRLPVVVAGISAMLVVVHVNTIVHPFTLADNRHYVFYVFRILLWQPVIKYLATPVYFICTWAAITALDDAWKGNDLEGRPLDRNKMGSKSQTQAGKVLPRSITHGLQEQNARIDADSTTTKETEKVSAELSSKAAVTYIRDHPNLNTPIQSNKVSFVIVWLVATALSLITAPLVEPRYFIVPWLFWRLHLPPVEAHTNEAKSDDETKKSTWQDRLKNSLYRVHDHRLWLETLWFLAINFVTGYIFLYWGFEWPQEPGRVQRFMW